MLVSKHGDPITGVDIHLLTYPPAPAPVPVPHPHCGLTFDPMDYIPVVGSTISVNGVPRTQAGTAGKAIPHIPLGGIWVPPPPMNEEEVFMGSMSIVADGTPLTYSALPVLTCQSVGMISPIRMKKPKKTYGMVLPTSIVSATPGGMPVMVGSLGLVPTIDMMGMAMKGVMAAAGPLARMANRATGGALANTWRTACRRFQNKVGDLLDNVGLSRVRNRVQDSICSVTGHPVNVATGQLYTEAVDLELPGPIPFSLSRVWRSTSKHNGDFGSGWHHSYDFRLYVAEEVSVVQLSDGRIADFLTPTDGTPSYNKQEKLYLYVDKGRFYLKDLKGNFKVFGEPADAKGARYLQYLSDPHGNRLRFKREGKRLLAIRDTCGRVLNVKTDEQCRITEIYGPHPTIANQQISLLKYQYSHDGDLICVKDAHDNPFLYQYQNHLLVKETDREGFSFYFEFDRDWQASGDHTKAYCVKTWGDGNLFYRDLTYDLTNQYTKSVDSKGGVTHYYWNDMGVVTTEVNPVGGKKQTVFDEFANKLSEKDSQGNETKYEYDDWGQLITVTEPNGGKRHFVFDQRHDLVSATDPLGNTWHYEYDAFHKLTARNLPNGHKIEYGYDIRGLLVEVKTSSSTQRLVWLDGLLRKVELEQGITKVFQYDQLGRVAAIQDFDDQVTKFEYNLLGQLTCKVNKDGTTERYGYNARGQLANYTDALHRSTNFEYSYIALTNKKLANGYARSYHYDTELNLVELINENRDSYRFEYDKHERMVKEVAFDGRVQRYEYDEIDNLIKHYDGKDRSTVFARDAYGRVLEKTSSDGETSHYQYNLLGRITEASNAYSEIRFSYDAFGNALSEQQNEHTIEHSYNELGIRSETKLPNGQVISYQYNIFNEISDIKLNGKVISKSSYDRLGREVQRQLGNAVQIKEYDVMGRLTQFSLNGKSSKIIDRGYRYDAVGNLTSILDAKQGVTDIVYDPMDRVLSAVNASPEKFVFDPAGNLIDDETTHLKGYCQGNRVRVFEDKHFDYDDVGNMVRERSGKAQVKVKEFQYNHQNQLVQATVNGQRFHYTYDALGRRISKSDAFGKTSFLWNGDVLLSEQRKHLEKTYIYEPYSFKPLCQIQDGKLYFYQLDQVGLPRELTDENGSIVWQAKYKVYGNVVAYDEEQIENNLRYQGQYYDSETGLYYNRFRYYHPELGRFISQDPIGLWGGEHIYEYSPNTFGWVDPLGLANNAYGAKKADTPHTIAQGGNRTAGAPRTNQPNSIHEQIRPDGSRSVTYYDEKGRMFSREDYGQLRTHGVLGRGADGRSVPHEHRVNWSDRGPIGKQYRELDSDGRPVGPWHDD